jgi:hypothetical protein
LSETTLLPHTTPSIGLEPLGNRSPLADYMWSLDAMTTLPDLALLPGHGPAGGSLHARAAELMDHHRDRLEQSLTAMCRGAATAHLVASRLWWTRQRRRLHELDAFSQMLAVTETVAHLDLLAYARPRNDRT